MNLLYVSGVACIAVGGSLIYAAGVRDAEREFDAEKWRLADNPNVGIVDDAYRFRNRHSPTRHTAQSDT